MTYSLRDIFNDVIELSNSIATPEQKEVIFRSSVREFFSIVKPIVFIENEVFLLVSSTHNINKGFKDELDIFSLGIGDFEIVEIIKTLEHTALRISPLNIDDFRLNESYIGGLQLVIEFFITKVDKNNFSMMQSAGIDTRDMFNELDISTLRDILKRDFQAIIGTVVEVDIGTIS